MFKIGNSRELPVIPEHLSDDGKDFVKLCLQRNPHHRPTAAQLLEHPFVKNAAPIERPILSSEPSDTTPGVTNGVKILVHTFSHWFFDSSQHIISESHIALSWLWVLLLSALLNFIADAIISHNSFS